MPSKSTASRSELASHVMREVRIGKVTINTCVGKSGEPLERAKKILTEIVGQTPCSRNARRTVKDWGIREGEPISCMVTLRGDKAQLFMRNALDAIGNKLKESSFDEKGNFGFGIREHIEIPGTRYVPELGIIGMTINVTLERPGFRTKRRTRQRTMVGRTHEITKAEAIRFIKQKFPVEISGVDVIGEAEAA